MVEQIKHRAIENVLRRAGRQDARRLMHLLAKGESTRRVHDLISENRRQLHAGVSADQPRSLGADSRVAAA